MLVALQIVTRDLPLVHPFIAIDEKELRASIDAALLRVTTATGTSLAHSVAAEALVVIITAQIATQVAARLSVSTGILATGAAWSWQTLGISLIIGIAVDQVVSVISNWWSDPVGGLTTELHRKLDDIHTLIVHGSASSPGLRKQLQAFCQHRTEVRKKALLTPLEWQTRWSAWCYPCWKAFALLYRSREMAK